MVERVLRKKFDALKERAIERVGVEGAHPLTFFVPLPDGMEEFELETEDSGELIERVAKFVKDRKVTSYYCVFSSRFIEPRRLASAVWESLAYAKSHPSHETAVSLLAELRSMTEKPDKNPLSGDTLVVLEFSKSGKTLRSLTPYSVDGDNVVFGDESFAEVGTMSSLFNVWHKHVITLSDEDFEGDDDGK